MGEPAGARLNNTLGFALAGVYRPSTTAGPRKVPLRKEFGLMIFPALAPIAQLAEQLTLNQ